MNTHYFNEHFIPVWENLPTTLQHKKRTYSLAEKANAELKFKEIYQSFKKQAGNKQKAIKRINANLIPTIKTILSEIFGYQPEQTISLISENTFDITKVFIHQAKKFDDKLTVEEIFQACRNIWIMNGVQQMMDRPVEITQAMIAYSLLYPYTDNFLDNPEISEQEKIDFSNRFAQRLTGKNIEPNNNTEKAIFRLVKNIEEQFPRVDFPEVHQSLIDIHNAQHESLALIQCKNKVLENDILKISLYKGGASVVADGYLIAGKMTQKQEQFLYAYGAYLQFADDIQDIKEDSKIGQQTLSTYAIEKGKPEEIVIKTMGMGDKIFDYANCFVHSLPVHFQGLIKNSVDVLMIESVLLNDNLYPQKFVDKMESYFPVSKDFVKEHRAKLASNRLSIMQSMFDAALSEYELKIASVR